MKAYTKKFIINDDIEIVCTCEDTRYGFRHLARILMFGDTAKICYYNRTWEAWEFQSVIREVALKAKNISEANRQAILSFASDDHRRDDSDLKAIGLIAALGDIFGSSQKESNDWKTRMLSAGLSDKGLSIPDDWDQLPEDEKQSRLDKAIAVIKE